LQTIQKTFEHDDKSFLHDLQLLENAD